MARHTRWHSDSVIDIAYRRRLVNWNAINQEYEAAANWYERRTQVFLDAWASRIGMQVQNEIQHAIESIQNEATLDLQEFTQQVYFPAQAYSQNPAQWMYGETTQEQAFEQSLLHSPIGQRIIQRSPTLQAILQSNGVQSQLMDGHFWPTRGFIFEDLYASSGQRNLRHSIIAQLPNYIQLLMNSQVQSLLQNLLIDTTGRSGLNLGSRSAVTQGINNVLPSIRSDILIYPAGMQISRGQDANGHLLDNMLSVNTNSNGQRTYNRIEMNYLTEFDAEDFAWKIQNDDQALLNTYLDLQEMANVAGISLKTFSWARFITPGDGRTLRLFMRSVPLQNELNQQLSEANHGKGYLTEDWVDFYIIYYLSHQIFQIVSPMTIGFQASDQFLWMHDLLRQIYFRMLTCRVGRASTRVTKRTGNLSNDWYRRRVDDSSVYMYARTRERAVWRTRINRNIDRYGTVRTTQSVTMT